MAVRVAINGFGRIGRNILRAIVESGRTDIQVVAANDLGPVETNAHLLRYDSVHGRFPFEVTVNGDTITAGNQTFKMTAVKNPAEPFRFRFQDLDGRWVSLEDERFRGKAVIATIMGSWCPNCHDEAPLLVELYAKYRSRGLEIVNLSFEEGEEAANPNQLRAFRKRYGITYPVLVAGEPSQLAERLPQAVNLNTFPASFILGRDGRVRSVHAGFAGPAMGELHQELRRELTATIEGLLRQ